MYHCAHWMAVAHSKKIKTEEPLAHGFHADEGVCSVRGEEAHTDRKTRGQGSEGEKATH